MEKERKNIYLDYKTLNDVQLIGILRSYNEIEYNEILDFLEESLELKDKKILKFSYIEPRITFRVIDKFGKKEIFIFNLETNQFEKEAEQNISKAPKFLENSENILSAMDYIFSHNKDNKIDEKDILTTEIYNKNGLDLKGKNLRDLQIIYRENQKKLDEIQSTFNSKQLKEFNKQQKKYLEFVVGVGDKFEGGASFLLETKTNYEKIIDNIVKNSTLTEVFLYMIELHQKIDSNNWQSESVEKSYEMTMELLSYRVFDRLKEENAADSDFIIFSKIITGRGKYKGNGNFESSDIDDNLRNPELALEALTFVFTRNGGMFDKIGIKNLDKSLVGKSVSDLNKELEFELKYISEKETQSKIFYDVLGYQVLNQSKGKKYEDLDFDTQVKFGFINKLIKELKERREKKINNSNSYPYLYPYGNISSTKGKVSTNPGDKNSLNSIIQKIGEDYLKESKNNIEKIFSSNNIFDKTFWARKTAKDFGLIGVYEEAYELFVNMNGVGLATFSDTSVSVSKYVGKFIGIVAVSMGAAILTSGTSLVAQGAVGGAAGSVASWLFFPTGYDSTEEAMVDLSSDLLLGTATGAAGGKLTQVGIDNFGKVGANGKKVLSGKQEAALTGLDVGILGFPPELLRQHIFNKIYHGQDLIIESEDDNLQKIYEKIEEQEKLRKIEETKKVEFYNYYY